MTIKKKKTRKIKKKVLNYREELKNSKLLLKLKKSKENPLKKEKKKKTSRSTKLTRKPVKTKTKAEKTTNKKEVNPKKKKENNITEEKYQETQYYNEFDEELLSKSKIYDLFTIIIKTNKLTGNKRYYCTINCVYKNKKQQFDKEVTTTHEVILFFGNSTAVKRLYKKAKISTKITL